MRGGSRFRKGEATQTSNRGLAVRPSRETSALTSTRFVSNGGYELRGRSNEPGAWVTGTAGTA